jgi:glycosyltransferase involved in cell wall biosynthesis
MANNDTIQPLVSIVIPTYNNATYISDAVISAMQQDYVNLEIIIIDDYSVDSTAEIVSSFTMDPRIRYFKNDSNLGRVATYHKGLYQLAKGEWYINLDGDDYLTDTAFVSKAIRWIYEYTDVVMVAGSCQRLVNEEKDYLISSKYEPEVSCIDGKRYFLDLPSQKASFSHLTTLYNRKQAMELGFYKEDILSADFESLYRLMLTGNVVSYNKVVGVWRIHEKNVSSNSFFLTDEILRNFKFVTNAASFAKNYFSKNTVQAWKKSFIIQIIESYILKVLIVKPGNSFTIVFELFKKYPACFINACFKILVRNIKKLGK